MEKFAEMKYIQMWIDCYDGKLALQSHNCKLELDLKLIYHNLIKSNIWSIYFLNVQQFINNLCIVSTCKWFTIWLETFSNAFT